MASSAVPDAAEIEGEVPEGAHSAFEPTIAMLPRPFIVLGHVVDTVLAVVLLGQLGITFTNVILRSFFQISLVWANETAGFALPLIAFLGGAVAYARNRHLSFKSLTLIVSPATNLLLAALCDWIVLGMAIVVLIADVPTLPEQWSQATPMLGISLFWRAVAVPIGMILLAIFACGRLWMIRSKTVWITGAVFAVIAITLAATHHTTGSETHGLFPVIATLITFVVLLVIGLPIGFILISATAIYIALSGTAVLAGLPARMLTGSDLFVLLALPFFILAGGVMERGGISARLVGFVSSFVRQIHGGMLHVTIGSMFLFSEMSGSKAADMAAVGSITTDMLRRAGYKPSEGVAVLNAAAVMGETIPPSISMLVLASITTVSLTALFAGGLLPAATMALALFVLAFERSRRMGIKLYAPASLGEIGRAALIAIPPLLMPALLFGGIISGVATPTEVSSFAVVYGLFLALVCYRSLNFTAFREMLSQATTLSGMILMIVGCASAFTWALTIAYRPEKISDAIIAAHLSPPGFMAVTFIMLIVFGMFLEGLPAMLIFAPLLLPIAQKLGIDPVYYGVVVIIAKGLGVHLPPVGIGYYVACVIGKATAEESFKPAMVYMAVTVVGLAVVTAFPAITTIVPDMLHMQR